MSKSPAQMGVCAGITTPTPLVRLRNIKGFLVCGVLKEDMPTLCLGSTASIGYREITEDDDVALECEELIGGLLISSVRSSARGGATELISRLIAAHPNSNMALVAFAESGDHARLMRLYSRFGFYVADGRDIDECPFGALMFRCP